MKAIHYLVQIEQSGVGRIINSGNIEIQFNPEQIYILYHSRTMFLNGKLPEVQAKRQNGK